MSSLRAGISQWWTQVLSLVDTELVSADTLYTRAINRAVDNTAWLRDDIVRRAATLASVTGGSVGKVTGSVDLSTLTYDATIGTFNGKTFQIQSDNSGLKTVTFLTGAGSAPTGPGDLVSQINTQTAGNPLASVDSAGHLSVSSVTAGGSGTINIVGGSGVTLLGFTVAQNATGASTGADGASAVGVGPVVGASFILYAGNLRAVLQYLADNLGTAAGVGISSRLVTRAVPSTFAPDGVGFANIGIGGGVISLVSTNTSVTLQFRPPHGQTLTGATMLVRGAAAHGGLPANMPTVQVYEQNLTTGAFTTVASQVDTSASTAAYQAIHSISVTGMSRAIDAQNCRYYMQLNSESSTNALAGLVAWGGTFTFQRFSALGED